MRIGLAYDLKPDGGAGGDNPAGAPDDWQEEFDSPATIEAVAEALRCMGHDVIHLGDGRGLVERLLADSPDLVFNIAEGQGVGRSREARVPAVLELLGIPHTGSDPLALAVSLDKDCCKRLVASAGVVVPRGIVMRGKTNGSGTPWAGFPFPAIVKPAWEGSSKGIRSVCLVDRAEALPDVLAGLARDYAQPVLVEEFIHGPELTVGVLGNDPPNVLGVMQVLPREPEDRFIYSLEVKRDFQRRVRYESPPTLPANLVRATADAALLAFRALGCRDVARVDFRIRDGLPYFLEINPLPGLNPDTSDLVILARLVGWNYSQLIRAIVDAALARHSDRLNCCAER